MMKDFFPHLDAQGTLDKKFYCLKQFIGHEINNP